MYEWDAFISHASEDKQSTAEPLSLELRRRGMRCWLDKSELRLGDDFLTKMNDGMARCFCGVLIISPRFMGKKYTNHEMEQLLNEAQKRSCTLIPIAHEIDRKSIIEQYRSLETILMGTTEGGIEALASQISSEILGNPTAPVNQAAPLPRRLDIALDADVAGRDLVSFLGAHRSILLQALNVGRKTEVHESLMIGNASVDFAVCNIQPTTNSRQWHMLFMTPCTRSPEHKNGLSPELSSRLDEAVALKRLLAKDPSRAEERLQGYNQNAQYIVVGGRRRYMNDDARALLLKINQGSFGISIRSYDWLLDAAAELWEKQAVQTNGATAPSLSAGVGSTSGIVTREQLSIFQKLLRAVRVR